MLSIPEWQAYKPVHMCNEETAGSVVDPVSGILQARSQQSLREHCCGTGLGCLRLAAHLSASLLTAMGW